MRERDSKEASGVLRARSWVEDEERPAVEAEADGLRAGGDQECCSDRGGAVLTEEAEASHPLCRVPVDRGGGQQQRTVFSSCS